MDLKEQFHKKEVPTGEQEREATEIAIPDQEHLQRLERRRGKKAAWTRKASSTSQSKDPSGLAEGGFAGVAGAMGAEVVVAEDAGGVAIIEIDLDGVVTDLRGGIGAGLGLVHGENQGGG